MAPTNWLSFSLSPMDMLRSSESQFISYESSSSTHSPHYFINNFYANGWGSSKEVEGTTTMAETETHHSQEPKLEDFSIVRYSDNNQTDTEDSSLTPIYDHGSNAYFGDQHDLKAIAGFQAFSTNSGSEVDDSATVTRTQLGGEFVSQSAGNELGFSNGLSLAVSNHRSCKETAIVAAESDCTKKMADTFGQRTSIYRGVTRHRWTGRYEAHLWDNSCRREGQARKGRQVYLGGYDKEDKAARAYDLAALKYWGPTATTNFPVANYAKELEEMKYVSKQEFIASLRRKSSGFSRGASVYRGVTRHHQQGRWQARIGRVAGNKDLYLGTFATEEEAAEAYDIAAIKFRGMNAVTNFEMNRYDVEAIMKRSLPIGGAAKRLKLSLKTEHKPDVSHEHQSQGNSGSGNINFAATPPDSAIPYENLAALYNHNLFQHLQAAMHNNSGSTSSMAANGLFGLANLIDESSFDLKQFN